MQYSAGALRPREKSIEGEKLMEPRLSGGQGKAGVRGGGKG